MTDEMPQERPVITQQIHTTHPETYLLLNFADHTAWRMTRVGRWMRVNWPQPLEWYEL